MKDERSLFNRARLSTFAKRVGWIFLQVLELAATYVYAFRSGEYTAVENLFLFWAWISAVAFLVAAVSGETIPGTLEGSGAIRLPYRLVAARMLIQIVALASVGKFFLAVLFVLRYGFFSKLVQYRKAVAATTVGG